MGLSFMKKTDLYKVGFIMKPHGLKGEVTVSLDADSPADWSRLKSVFVDINGQFVPHFIEGISVKGDKAFVKFEDVSSIDEARKLQKHSLFLQKATRPKLQRGDFYNDEITHFAVEDARLGPIGKVVAVEQTNHSRFLIVAHNIKELMIPVNGPFLTGINKSKRIITVNLPEGFLDI
jgi:16S rRNA processing protein RimM